MPVSVVPLVGHIVDEDNKEEDRDPLHIMYQIMFEDHNLRERTIINPQSILKMRIERKESASNELRFRAQSSKLPILLILGKKFRLDWCGEQLGKVGH